MNALAALGQVAGIPEAAGMISGSPTAPVAAGAGPESFNSLIGLLRDLMESVEDVPDLDAAADFQVDLDLNAVSGDAAGDRAFRDLEPEIATPDLALAGAWQPVTPAVVRRMLGASQQVVAETELSPAEESSNDSSPVESVEVPQTGQLAGAIPYPPLLSGAAEPLTQGDAAPFLSQTGEPQIPPVAGKSARVTGAKPGKEDSKAPLAFGLRLTPAPAKVEETPLKLEPPAAAETEITSPEIEINAETTKTSVPNATQTKPTSRDLKADLAEPHSASAQADDKKAAEKIEQPRTQLDKHKEAVLPAHRSDFTQRAQDALDVPKSDSLPSAALAPAAKRAADVVSALRSSENIALSRPVTPASPSTAAQEIAVRVSRPDAAPVDVHFREHRGEIQVAVRTADAGLQSDLRRDLNTLVDSLENAGYRTEAVVPRDARSRSATTGWEAATLSSQPLSQQSGSQSRGESHGGSGDHTGGRQQNPQQQQNQQQQQRRAPRSLWQETLEQTR